MVALPRNCVVPKHDTRRRHQCHLAFDHAMWAAHTGRRMIAAPVPSSNGCCILVTGEIWGQSRSYARSLSFLALAQHRRGHSWPVRHARFRGRCRAEAGARHGFPRRGTSPAGPADALDRVARAAGGHRADRTRSHARHWRTRSVTVAGPAVRSRGGGAARSLSILFGRRARPVRAAPGQPRVDGPASRGSPAVLRRSFTTRRRRCRTDAQCGAQSGAPGP